MKDSVQSLWGFVWGISTTKLVLSRVIWSRIWGLRFVAGAVSGELCDLWQLVEEDVLGLIQVEDKGKVAVEIRLCAF
eukprot:883136-Prorocentrum_minimum.AAC.2